MLWAGCKNVTILEGGYCKKKQVPVHNEQNQLHAVPSIYECQVTDFTNS